MDNEQHDITRILKKAGEGDNSALNQLMPLVYDELKELAERLLKNERPDHTLQPTALVHEAYVRLIRQDIECRTGHTFLPSQPGRSAGSSSTTHERETDSNAGATSNDSH